MANSKNSREAMRPANHQNEQIVPPRKLVENFPWNEAQEIAVRIRRSADGLNEGGYFIVPVKNSDETQIHYRQSNTHPCRCLQRVISWQSGSQSDVHSGIAIPLLPVAHRPPGRNTTSRAFQLPPPSSCPRVRS
jgi:hypothetical protein